MRLDYRVNTTVDDQSIRQDVEALVDGKYERLSTQLMNLRDQGVREALIKLGWTPPNQSQAAAPKRRVFTARDIKSWDVRPDLLRGGRILRGVTHCGRAVGVELNDIQAMTSLDVAQVLADKLNEESA